MPAATHLAKGRSRGKNKPNPEAQAQTQAELRQRATDIKRLHAYDQFQTATIHNIRLQFLAAQLVEYASEQQDARKKRNFDLLVEFGQLAEKRRAIEEEFLVARREYTKQMDELTQRLEASLSGLTQQAKEAGLPESSDFKDDSLLE